jgi:hypothetical protein
MGRSVRQGSVQVVFDKHSMETDLERGRRLGRKYVLGVFVALASLFVVVTTLEITLEVFGRGLHGSLAAPIPGQGACSEDLRRLAGAVERAIAASGRTLDEGRATTRYREALKPEWDKEGAIEGVCAGEAGGSDAVAAVVRLRLAGEEVARRQASELGPIRQDLEAYLGH